MAQITIEADIDSYLDSFAPNNNFGTSTVVVHGVAYSGGSKVERARAIGNFDCSAIAGLTVTSAKLVRHVYRILNGGVTARLSRCTRPADWTETGVTWNKYDGTNAWTSAGGDFDDPGPPAFIDYTTPTSTGDHEVTGLKDMVQDALDNRNDIVSLITRLKDEAPGVDTEEDWRAKENGSDIWRLVIDYTPAAGLNADLMRHRWG